MSLQAVEPGRHSPGDSRAQTPAAVATAATITGVSYSNLFRHRHRRAACTGRRSHIRCRRPRTSNRPPTPRYRRPACCRATTNASIDARTNIRGESTTFTRAQARTTGMPSPRRLLGERSSSCGCVQSNNPAYTCQTGVKSSVHTRPVYGATDRHSGLRAIGPSAFGRRARTIHSES